MQKLPPLRQWICDECGEVIEEPSHGYVEWDEREGTGVGFGFRIVHHNLHSPLKPDRNCYRYQAGSHLHLEHFLGADGILRLLALVDPGEFHIPDFDGPYVENIREWVTFFRRLHVPYFEEARLYLSRAAASGEVGGVNEVALYQADTMERIVDDFRPGGRFWLG